MIHNQADGIYNKNNGNAAHGNILLLAHSHTDIAFAKDIGPGVKTIHLCHPC